MSRNAPATADAARDLPQSRVKYPSNIGFYAEVRRRVEADLFRATRKYPLHMLVKTAILFAWLLASYVLLVWFAPNWLVAGGLCISLGMAVAGVGFNVTHDSNHGAYSKHRFINQAMALTLDMVGASSYVWAHKHNSLHHRYTNVTGLDDDISKLPWARFSPHQPRNLLNRFQHIYLWLFYGLLLVKWNFIDDLTAIARGNIAGNPMPRPSGWNLAVLISGKLFFFSWAFLLPLAFNPWWAVLLGYIATSFVTGAITSVVFQLAHCVEEADFPTPNEESAEMEKEWAVHQVESTVDFARDNNLLRWYLGGLNFQIEHHLFPRVSHMHYPAISRIVEETAQAYSVRYFAYDSMLDALTSHARWLRRMGAS
jgi:linoleoyl-CoA desaturase